MAYKTGFRIEDMDALDLSNSKRYMSVIRCSVSHTNRPRSIYHYSNMAPKLSFFCLSIPQKRLGTKKATPNIEVCPENLGALLAY